MLFEKLDHVSELWESLIGLVLDLRDISQVSHDLSEKLFVSVIVQSLWNFLDSILHLVNEFLDVR